MHTLVSSRRSQTLFFLLHKMCYLYLKTLYGMSEMLDMSVTSFDESEIAHSQRLQGRMLPTYNSEVRLLPKFSKVYNPSTTRLCLYIILN